MGYNEPLVTILINIPCIKQRCIMNTLLLIKANRSLPVTSGNGSLQGTLVLKTRRNEVHEWRLARLDLYLVSSTLCMS